MAIIILLLIIGLPLLELSVLIDVGGEIGAFSTVLLCFITAGIGLSLVRLQGLTVLRNMQTASRDKQPIGEALIHGFFLLIAGVFLFIPGFVTDFFGALLLIPLVRMFLGKAGLASIIVRRTYRQENSTVTIDGEFQETPQDVYSDEITREKDKLGENDKNSPNNP